MDRFGEGWEEVTEGAGDVAKLRAEARDLRKPCAEDGRPGEFARLPELGVSADGGNGDHDFSARAASNWRKNKLEFSSVMAGVPCRDTGRQPNNGRCRKDSYLGYIRLDLGVYTTQ